MLVTECRLHKWQEIPPHYLLPHPLEVHYCLVHSINSHNPWALEIFPILNPFLTLFNQPENHQLWDAQPQLLASMTQPLHLRLRKLQVSGEERLDGGDRGPGHLLHVTEKLYPRNLNIQFPKVDPERCYLVKDLNVGESWLHEIWDKGGSVWGSRVYGKVLHTASQAFISHPYV